MPDAQEFSDLVGQIYDAALRPALWPAAIEAIANFAGGSAGCLLTHDRVQGTGGVFYGFGDQPRYRQLYFNRYMKLDPVGPALSEASVGQIVSNSSVMPWGKFLDTQFYQEWMRPQGWLDNLFCPLTRSQTAMTAIAIARGPRDGIADEQMRQRVRLLMPHIRRSVLIGQIIELRTAEGAALADTLDGLRASVFLVDASMRIVHANASGRVMLTEETLVRSIGGKLSVNDASPNRDLQASIVPAAQSDKQLGVKGIAIRLRRADGSDYVARVLPLASRKRRVTAAYYAASAAIFIHEARVGVGAQPQALADAYRLTAGEFRVLHAVVMAGGVRGTAALLHLSEATVKTHLHRIFAKTGASRQADLVKLVAGYSTPLIE